MGENRVQAYFEGKYVPLEEAKISILTHAFLYGTACFGGVRAYWNQEKGQLFGFRFEDHYRRLLNAAKLLRMNLKYSNEDLRNITVELLRKANYRENVYLRPVAYKSSQGIGVKLHGLEDDFTMAVIPFGKYIDNNGLRVTISGWRRLDDNMLPSRGKINGGYVNASLAKSDAVENGYDEAIFLTANGHVAEGSAENLFIVRKGQLITPPSTDDVL
ncbi:MAG TPA: branched chain amino acid aminotransferase, partial [Firmicutes bacterium]|nr:branched chain amino acid aminotransferase [Bacillota bacterium]HCF88837.1 branched chain amino acid aminotransferase [Bacillota bacterium]HCX70390.1 branched chain amino acid aminotransferase [Bacillota bacterium]